MKGTRIPCFALAALAATSAFSTPVEEAQAYLDRQLQGLPGRVEIKVGELDSRLQLAPCARVVPFLPAGSRLWGRTFLGLECAEGARWRVTLPVEVRVFAPVPVTIRPLRPGETVSEADVENKEYEVTTWAPGLVGDLSAVEGRVLSRPVAAGQPLRPEWFKAPQAITAGEPVRVNLVGQGFTITLDGKALNGAGLGESVRVQLSTGRTVGGTLRQSRLVEVGL